VVAVNFGDKPETIAAYFEKQDFKITALRQNKDEASRAFGVLAYPTIYVISGEGTVAWRSAAFDEEILRSELDRVAPKK
jgi:hypothetical protein